MFNTTWSLSVCLTSFHLSFLTPQACATHFLAPITTISQFPQSKSNLSFILERKKLRTLQDLACSTAVMSKVTLGVVVVCATTVCATAALVVRHCMITSCKWSHAMAILKRIRVKERDSILFLISLIFLNKFHSCVLNILWCVSPACEISWPCHLRQRAWSCLAQHTVSYSVIRISVAC